MQILKAIGILVLIVIGFVIAISGYIYLQQKDKCEDVYRQQQNFPIEQLSLSNLEVGDSGTEVSGRLTNRSNQVVFGFWLDIKAEDCVGGNCTVVGKQPFFLETIVPAGEARDFLARQYLDNLLTKIHRRGELRFTAQLSSPGAVSEHERAECAGRF